MREVESPSIRARMPSNMANVSSLDLRIVKGEESPEGGSGLDLRIFTLSTLPSSSSLCIYEMKQQLQSLATHTTCISTCLQSIHTDIFYLVEEMTIKPQMSKPLLGNHCFFFVVFFCLFVFVPTQTELTCPFALRSS